MIYLKRIATSDNGTFGVLIKDNVPLCVTLEDPWRLNKAFISCVPEGVYKVEKHTGKKYDNVWIVKDVPNRSAILIHWGNTINDTQGCILVGKGYGKLLNLPSITESKNAIEMLRKVLTDSFELKIINCWSI